MFMRELKVKNGLSMLMMLCFTMLVGCGGQGPEVETELAVQGFLSGDLSRDGKLAAVGSIHHGGSLWDLAKKERLFNWNHSAGQMSTIRTIAFSGDSRRAATTVEDNIVVWDAISGKPAAFWKAPSRILALKLSWDGRYALLGLNDSNGMYFDLEVGSQVFSFPHDAEVRTVDLSDDGLLAMTGGDDFTAKVWELKTGKKVQQFVHQNQIKTVAISSKGKYGFTTSQREDSIIWDLASGTEVLKLPNRYTNFTVARFSDEENQLLLGEFRGALSLLNIPSGAVEAKWQAKPRKAYGGASSKAVVSAVFLSKTGVSALMSDGMYEEFAR